MIGVDVGTGSARAAVFDLRGRRLGYASHPIRLWRPEPDFAEQSSSDVWQAVVAAVRMALQQAGKPDGRGIGFDATCSLVVLDADGAPVSVSRDGEDGRNVVVWMDHRAIAEAAHIDATGSAGAALCGRAYLAGNGDAEAAVAQAEPAGDLAPRRTFP